MSIQNALISQASTLKAGLQLQRLVNNEAAKGCSPVLSQSPTSLEPPYTSLAEIKEKGIINPETTTLEDYDSSAFYRYQVRISSEYEFEASRVERFLKQLASLQYRCGFDLIGNNEWLEMYVFCHREDMHLIKIAFAAEIPGCVLREEPSELSFLNTTSNRMDGAFYDYYPLPPYSGRITTPEELRGSSLESLVVALGHITSPQVGWYQVLFKKTDNSWGENVELLQDIIFSNKLLTGMEPSSKAVIQSPSGSIQDLCFDLNQKVSPFKPFFHTAIRLLVTGGTEDENENYLRAISGFTSLFYQGGQPFNILSHKDYKRHFLRDFSTELFLNGRVYRPGFLTNSRELLSIIHPPPLIRFEKAKNISNIFTAGVEIPEATQMQGIQIGSSVYGDHELPVFIPEHLRCSHCRIVGSTNMGKSTLLLHMVYQDILNGEGVVFIDPHGDGVKTIRNVIPEEFLDKVIYLDFADTDHVLIWNPLSLEEGEDISRATDALINAIRSFIDRNSYGDRMEHLLRNIFHSLFQVPGCTLFDVLKLLSPKSKSKKTNPEFYNLFKAILHHESDNVVKHFWLNDFLAYAKNELAPPRHKLSKFFMAGSLSLTLSQPDNTISFKEILAQQKIVLVDLSSIGPMAQEVVGCILISRLHTAALQRSSIPRTQRLPLRVYADESYRFASDNLSHALVECRKFNVSFHLSHQFFSQFSKQQNEALAGVASTIAFKVSGNDAYHLSQHLQGRYEPSNLVDLEPYNAIARIGNEILEFKTHPFEVEEVPGIKNKIIQQSFQKYYTPKDKAITNAGKTGVQIYSDDSQKIPQKNIEEFKYDEF